MTISIYSYGGFTYIFVNGREGCVKTAAVESYLAAIRQYLESVVRREHEAA